MGDITGGLRKGLLVQIETLEKVLKVNSMYINGLDYGRCMNRPIELRSELWIGSW